MILFIVTLLLALATPVQATILFSENYNYTGDSNVNSFGGDTCVNQTCTDLKAHGWDFVRGQCKTYCSMQIVPAPFGRTGKALLYEYQADQDLQTVPTQDEMNSNLIKVFNPTLGEFWGHVWFATDVDTVICTTCIESRWFCCGTKLHYVKPTLGPSWITGQQTGEAIPTPVPSGANPGIAIQEAAVCPNGGTPGFKGGNGCGSYDHNAGTVHVADKQWHCIQYHWKLNSAYTVADGQLQMWIDNIQVVNWPNVLWVDGTWFFNGQQITLTTARISQIEVYRQHSNHMKRYEADLIWATTQAETTCSGTPPPPPDTTPPGPPTGVGVD